MKKFLILLVCVLGISSTFSQNLGVKTSQRRNRYGQETSEFDDLYRNNERSGYTTNDRTYTVPRRGNLESGSSHLDRTHQLDDDQDRYGQRNQENYDYGRSGSSRLDQDRYGRRNQGSYDYDRSERNQGARYYGRSQVTNDDSKYGRNQGVDNYERNQDVDNFGGYGSKRGRNDDLRGRNDDFRGRNEDVRTTERYGGSENVEDFSNYGRNQGDNSNDRYGNTYGRGSTGVAGQNGQDFLDERFNTGYGRNNRHRGVKQ